jgi:glyoxylase-like metal-dependent hydrolase (beta-lactamase superfamily II)
MSGPQPNNAPGLPFAMYPTDTYLSGSKEVFFNGEAIQVLHQPNAHTDGDSIVFFRRSDVVAAGDIFTPGRFPGIDLDRGGSINGLINGLNHIIEITIPADKQEGGTYVIPGHGHLCDEADVVEYRDMATIVRDRVQEMVKKGMTLAQVKDAKPTLDYDPLYGQANGATDRFVEQVYKSLSAKK